MAAYNISTSLHPNCTFYGCSSNFTQDLLTNATSELFTGFGDMEDSDPAYMKINANYPGKVKQVPLWEVCVKLLFYVIIIVIALVGNILVVFIVWRNKRMRTATNYYIVNLAISDLLVTCCCTWVHLVNDLTEGWVLGSFFCKINSFSQVLSLVSSILTLTLIACDRFFGIVFAMKAHMTERRAWVFIILVWMCSVGISSPLLVYRYQRVREWLDHLEIWCNDDWPPVFKTDPVTGMKTVIYPSRTVYYTFVSVMLYFLPILIMTVAYTVIIWRLRSSRIPGERLRTDVSVQDKVKRKVVMMLVIILSVFAVCWLPSQIRILYAEYRPNSLDPLPPWFSQFQFFADYMAFANSAFNPIIYAGFNENFKRGFKTVFVADRSTSITGSVRFRHGSFHDSMVTSSTRI